MSVLDIRIALESRLAALVPVVPIAGENADFTPPKDSDGVPLPYQELHLLPAEPLNVEFGPMFTEQGLLQVTLCYPFGAGPKAAVDRAQLVRDQFRRGLSLTKNSTVVTIARTPEIGIALVDEARYRLPVRVRWYANVTS